MHHPQAPGRALRRFVVLLVLGVCGGCGSGNGGANASHLNGDGGAEETSINAEGAATIGAAGGTVHGPDGSSIVIPRGALTTEKEIAIEQTSVDAPPLPPGFTPVGPMFAFTPHGTTFAVPVTVTLPFDTSSVPAGVSPSFYKTTSQNRWEHVGNATFGAGSVEARVSSFSFGQIVIPALVRSVPVREWGFGTFPGTGAGEVSVDEGTQTGGELQELVEFGGAATDVAIKTFNETIAEDKIANGYIFGTEDGLTNGLYVEAPFSKLGRSAPIGSIARLKQTQSFVKIADDATLSFTMAQVLMSATDCNLFAPSVGFDDTSIKTEVYFSFEAYTTEQSFFHAAGGATLIGSREEWTPSIWNYRFSRTTLWIDADFDFASGLIDFGDLGVCRRGYIESKGPMVHPVDLSTVAVGEKFTVQSDSFGMANNRRGGGAPGDLQLSAANAFLRDESNMDGSTLTFTGLEPADDPLLTPPVLGLSTVPCSSGRNPDPDAGVIEFSDPGYSVGEFAGASPVVRIVRTGGSHGAVSVTFTTSDGSATAGSDFTSETSTVFFADGDTAPRNVAVPLIGDALVEPDETVNLALSDPGGCAALGSRTRAVLTIADDDLAPPPSTSGLDDTFGTEGKASSTAFGGDRSAMALQADGKVVMVGGTFTDFVLARFDAEGRLDESFGTHGHVTTDMVPGEQEEALGVAVQPDGKVVVVGYTGVPRVPPAAKEPSNFALARYDATGKLDPTFGTGGKVVTGVQGIAYAVALQPDGKIVVAGDQLLTDAGADFSNFEVARFDENGTLDKSFGALGLVRTDVGDAPNEARNLVLVPGGGIVVSGAVAADSNGLVFDHTDVARYRENGAPDPSFGDLGTLAIDGATVGEGLALQRDGKLVLVGSIDVTVPPAVRGSVTDFAVMRLASNGSPDDSFGTAGSTHTSISGERDVAFAVTLQSDDKIVVAGRSSNIDTDFAVTRYDATGALDTSFVGVGKLTIDFFHHTDVAENLAVQPDGKLVVSGLARDTVDGYGVARINP